MLLKTPKISKEMTNGKQKQDGRKLNMKSLSIWPYNSPHLLYYTPQNHLEQYVVVTPMRWWMVGRYCESSRVLRNSTVFSWTRIWAWAAHQSVVVVYSAVAVVDLDQACRQCTYTSHLSDRQNSIATIVYLWTDIGQNMCLVNCALSCENINVHRTS